MTSLVDSTSSTRITFEIAFEGSAQCWKDADVCAIDLIGSQSEISANSVGKRESRLHEGRLKWLVPNNDSVRPVFEKKKFIDQLDLPSETGKTIQLSARVFESYAVPSNTLIMGVDGVVRSPKEYRARRHDIPVIIEGRSELKDGGCYLIKVRNVGEMSLRATFNKLDEQTANEQ